MNQPPLAPITIVLLALSIVLFLAALVAMGNERQYDSTDKPLARFGKYVVVDELTGCHYLLTPAGGLAPRLGADGKQLCGAEVPR